MIRADYALDEHRDTPIEEAKELGAIALYGSSIAGTLFLLFHLLVEACRIGIAFPFQLLSQIPTEETDIAMNEIIS